MENGVAFGRVRLFTLRLRPRGFVGESAGIEYGVEKAEPALAVDPGPGVDV